MSLSCAYLDVKKSDVRWITALVDTPGFRPLHTPADDSEHEYTAIQHFHDKLLKIRDRLKTEHGRKIGDKRHNVVSNLTVELIEFIY